jgi:hypothetical protein
MVDFPAFPQQKDMDSSISISLHRRGYFPDPHSQKGLLVPGRLPLMPSPVDPQYRTAPAFARLKAFLQIAHGIPLLGRP